MLEKQTVCQTVTQLLQWATQCTSCLC